MAVSYTKDQRNYAKANKLHLVTMAVPGLEWQGPTSKEEVDKILQFMTEFAQRRKAGREAKQSEVKE